MKPSKVLELAAKEVGYTEHPDNITKFSAEFGVKVAQWCGFFVDYIIKHAGGHEPKSHYTPTGAKAYQDANRWMTVGSPKAGDLIYFDFPHDGVDRISHIGICVGALGDGKILCIEGNTTPTDDGDQRNGGCVAVKVRPRSVIVGWGRPHYEADPDVGIVVADIVKKWRLDQFPKPYKGDLPKAEAPAKKAAPKGKK